MILVLPSIVEHATVAHSLVGSGPNITIWRVQKNLTETTSSEHFDFHLFSTKSLGYDLYFEWSIIIITVRRLQMQARITKYRFFVWFQWHAHFLLSSWVVAVESCFSFRQVFRRFILVFGVSQKFGVFRLKLRISFHFMTCSRKFQKTNRFQF